MKVCLQRATCAALFALATVLVAPLRAAAPAIEDDGGLFSKSAVMQSNRIVNEIYEQTRPHKDVVIQTSANLPPGVASAEELAKRIFREREVDGIVIAAVKQPGRLGVAVGRQTQARFTSIDRDHLVEIMLSDFRKKNFDQGLLNGLGFARQKLTEAFPTIGDGHAGQLTQETSGSKRVTEFDPGERRASNGLPTWAWALLIFGGVWVVLALFRAGSQTPSQGAGYSPQGYGAGSYSGGWGRSILGGMFGAMAGEWLYDRFARSGGEVYGAREEPTDRSDYGTGSDAGQVGGVGGGDFSDVSDTRDPGWDDSSDPGDFGGGNDSGGGDF